MQKLLDITFTAKTDTGLKRKRNEDCFVCSTLWNSYILTAVIDGNTVSKTVNRNTSNGPSIDSFCNAVDDIRDVEGDLMLELGADLVGPLIIAALTGGVGLVALLTAIGASASALSSGQRLNTLYARAEKAYKEV